MDDPLADILSSTSSPTSQAYLSHLTTLSLSELLSEPTTLQTQAHHLTSSLTSLTHSSYPTFLALHSTTNALSSSLDSLSSSLDALLTTSLPALEESAAAWHARTDAVLHERSRARVVLEQHDKIKDLFDIPLFIDTCVRNGYFSEALSLANHAMSLSVGAGAPLILTSIQEEVHHSITQMLLSLLATLHEPNRKLPALWKAVNFLRKMDAFGSGRDPSTSLDGENPSDRTVSSEEQLALAFLTGRLTCLAGALEPIARDINRLINNNVPTAQTSVSTSDSDDETTTITPRTMTDRDKEDVARYLKKYIDVWREGVYDIVTQYSTIFLEEQPRHCQQTSKSPPPTLPFHLLSSHSTQSTEPPRPLPHRQPPTHLLPLLTSHLLQQHLLPLLHTTLPLLPLHLLTPLLTQLTYCATAFARVGLDFRSLLGSMIETAVLHSVGREITDVGEKWVARVKAEIGPSRVKKGAHSKSATTTGKRPSDWLIVPSLVDSQAEPPPSPSSRPSHIPPHILASYPPLAEHTNALLGVLNSLRLLAPCRIMCDLLRVLEEVLGAGGEVLCEYLEGVLEAEGVQRNDVEKEREGRVTKMMGEVYFRVFVPFLRRALVEGVYGIKDIDGSEEMSRSRSEDSKNGRWTGGERLREAIGMWEDMCR